MGSKNKINAHPALKRWAILFRAYGARVVQISGSVGAAMGPGPAESPARRAKLISPLRQRWVPNIQELRSPFQGRHNWSEESVPPLKGLGK